MAIATQAAPAAVEAPPARSSRRKPALLAAVVVLLLAAAAWFLVLAPDSGAAETRERHGEEVGPIHRAATHTGRTGSIPDDPSTGRTDKIWSTPILLSRNAIPPPIRYSRQTRATSSPTMATTSPYRDSNRSVQTSTVRT